MLATSHALAGVFRGAGKTNVPMFVMLSSWCLLRITYITLTVRLIPVINVIFWAYPLTWTVSTIVFLIYYFRAGWLNPAAKEN
jgi:Na+-driven multidrug efflux pump